MKSPESLYVRRCQPNSLGAIIPNRDKTKLLAINSRYFSNTSSEGWRLPGGYLLESEYPDNGGQLEPILTDRIKHTSCVAAIVGPLLAQKVIFNKQPLPADIHWMFELLNASEIAKSKPNERLDIARSPDISEYYGVVSNSIPEPLIAFVEPERLFGVYGEDAITHVAAQMHIPPEHRKTFYSNERLRPPNQP